MKFRYFLDNAAGWARITVEHEAFSRLYCVSYCLGDHLTSLLGGLVALFQHEVNYRAFQDLAENHLEDANKDTDNDSFNYYPSPYHWVIDQEGSTVEFIFSRCEDPKKIDLKILEDYEEGEKECVFDDKLDKDELIDNILSSCDEMLSMSGIIGYYNNFWNEFPILNFLLLKNYRKGKLKFDDVEIKDHRGKPDRIHRTNLRGEVEYLVGDT